MRHLDQVSSGHDQCIRKRSVVRDDANHAAVRTVMWVPRFAHRAGPTRGVDVCADTLAHPARVAACVDDTDELMSEGSLESHVATHDFDIGVANPGEANANTRGALVRNREGLRLHFELTVGPSKCAHDGRSIARYALSMRLEELDYDLPEERIAQAPLAERDAARLLLVDAIQTTIEDRRILDIPQLLPPALWVVNDTRVLAARLHGRKPTGGRVELLLIEALDPQRWITMGRASKPLKAGTRVVFESGLEAEVEAKLDEGLLRVRFEGNNLESLLESTGEMPLPPYIRRAANDADDERYQTIFAEERGAVAAPTAGLHFSPALVDSLHAGGHEIARVTLHVGPGTFRPVKADDLDEHPMHEERYNVPEATVAAIDRARAEGRTVVAVGTTVVRTLESAAVGDRVRAGRGRTRLLIQPGYSSQVVDHLLTNFHLPRSTLLALVMAFGGVDTIRSAYKHAVDENYRFFSYGDAMLLRGIRSAT